MSDDAGELNGSPPPAVSEAERIAELHAYQVLDTDPESAFDGLVQVARVVADVPTALISLVDTDRQWFKARVGLEVCQRDRDSAFCDHVVGSGHELIVRDATADLRFVDNPLVTQAQGIRFYAGFPLRTPAGAVLGTLCVIDEEPRELSDQQLGLLRTLADQVMAQLQLRREVLERDQQLRERDRLMNRVAESEARYRNLVEHSLDVIASHRPDGLITYASPALQRVLGLDPQTALQPQVLAARAHPEDLPRFAAAMITAGAGVQGTVTGRFQHTDGSWRQLETSFLPIANADGTIREILSTGRDVTARVEADAALAAAHAELHRRRLQLEEAQRVAEVGSFTYEVATREITWSKELKRIFGVLPSFVPDLDSYTSMIHPDDRDVLRGTVDDAIARGGRYEVEHRLIRPDGEERILSARGQIELGDDGTPLRLSGTGQDVTMFRRTESERDEHAMMLRAVIQNNQSIIYVKDLDGRYLMVNRAFEEAFGLREGDLLGTDYVIDPAQAEEWQANDRRALAGPYRVEECAERPDGMHWYDTVKVPLSDKEGTTYAICGLSLDVTEQRRAEDEVARAVEAMATARDAAIAATNAKSAFLATMSHEIRTPMNAVIGMTGLLLDTHLDAEQRDLLETVRGSGDQLLSIINDILDFSKIESGDLELEDHPFELRDLVENAVAQFAATAGQLDLISHLAEDCPAVVLGDVVRLRQVLGNLVGNAVKFTQHGDVLLRVELDPGAPDPSETDGVRLRFTVADTGIGISAEGLDRLFRSFSQVDTSTTRVYGGTGLGLAISKAIVEAMGGELTVTSTPGIGSEFTFGIVLGRSDDPGPLIRPEDGYELASLTDRSVLVVDDNDTNRRILRLQLEGYGMVVTTSPSPLDAVALIGGGRRFDIAILDYAMPVMDGVQLAMALRQLPAGQRLPLVLLSSIGRRDRDDDQLFSAVLTKPMRSAPLFEAISRVLTLDPAESELSAPALSESALSESAQVGFALVESALSGIPRPGGPERQLPARRSGDRKLRILLAEDNEVNQKVGKLMLAKIGHQVDIAENGRDALEAIRHTFYDVVLMDIHMPVMDGLEATRRIRADQPADRQPRIIALTASVTKEDRAACVEAGMDGYLPKPVRAADLAAALAAIPIRQI